MCHEQAASYCLKDLCGFRYVHLGEVTLMSFMLILLYHLVFVTYDCVTVHVDWFFGHA